MAVKITIIVLVALAVAAMEGKGMLRGKNRRDFILYAVLLAVGTIYYAMTITDIPMLSPIDWLEAGFRPVSEPIMKWMLGGKS